MPAPAAARIGCGVVVQCVGLCRNPPLCSRCITILPACLRGIMRASSPPGDPLYRNMRGVSACARSGPPLSSFSRPKAPLLRPRPAAEAAVQVSRASPIQTPSTSPSFSCQHPPSRRQSASCAGRASSSPQIARVRTEVNLQIKSMNTEHTKSYFTKYTVPFFVSFKHT